MSSTSKAIVLSRQNFGEADRYVTFLSQEWGILTTLAKSARKSKRRYVGGLDLFCHDKILIRGNPREKPYLVELSVLNCFMGIREDFDRTLSAGKVTEWVLKLVEPATPVPKVYSLLGQTLALLEKETQLPRLELLVLLFKLKLLSLLGLKPRMDACVRCNEKKGDRLIFDIELGGLVCAPCASGRHSVSERLFLEPVEENFLVLSDPFSLAAWQSLQLPAPSAQRLNRLVTQFTSFHTHVRLPV